MGRSSHLPTFDDYIEVGIVSSAMRFLGMLRVVALEDCNENQTTEWFESKPKTLQAYCVLYRLENDICSYEDEMRIGEVANGVNCYMKQYGVTKVLAVSEIKKMIRDDYKIVMEECLMTKCVSRPVLVRCLNMVRLIKLYYTEGDGFTNPHGKLKDLISSMFFHPLPL
ncbi:unnamed protein product [Arabidopsis arenosa]|uniref:Terpene synthase metal-binding domain-containing protein n=1 Tax=Arabidopsis arenosa TaxID=38785 RepID=A0A8S1ZHL0_ARAAE|nr:unnamed protein product [Arabidopsis arenosa]